MFATNLFLSFGLHFIVVNTFLLSNDNDEACPASCKCVTDDSNLRKVRCYGLTTVPHGIPSNTMSLDITECNITSLQADQLMNITDLQTLSFRVQNDQKMYNLTSLHLKNLSVIAIIYSQLSSVPQLLPSYIKKLSFYHASIETLTSGSFQNYPKLQLLLLISCKLAHLELGAFDGLQALETIDLQYNSLVDESFPLQPFRDSHALRVVVLMSNNLTHVVPNLPDSLIYVDYSNNSITELKALAFKSTPNLTHISFQQNCISVIEDFTFQTMASLVSIDLSENKLVHITNNTFTGVHSLAELDISGNVIKTIEPDAFKSLTSLTNLRIVNNLLESLEPEVLNNLLSSTRVSLGGSNPWKCDCHLRWIREAMDNATYYTGVSYGEDTRCALPTKVEGECFNNLKPSDFVCE